MPCMSAIRIFRAFLLLASSRGREAVVSRRAREDNHAHLTAPREQDWANAAGTARGVAGGGTMNGASGRRRRTIARAGDVSDPTSTPRHCP